jgi:hypothetical protein
MEGGYFVRFVSIMPFAISERTARYVKYYLSFSFQGHLGFAKGIYLLYLIHSSTRNGQLLM